MFPAVTQPGRFACMPQEGGLGAIQPIEPQMHLSFLSLQLRTVDSGVSGFRLSERQHQFRNRVIFQMPRNHISDAQASYFRCSSIQRRYNETLAFTGTEPLQIDGPMILLYLKSCLGSHPEELNKLKMGLSIE